MRFVIDLWPDDDGEPVTDPVLAVREAIKSIRDMGEEFSWDVLDDVTGEVLAENIIPINVVSPDARDLSGPTP